MIAPFVFFTIYRWDIDGRKSTIVGVVGEAGLVFFLVQGSQPLDFRATGIVVWFVAAAVAVLDSIYAEIHTPLVRSRQFRRRKV